MYPVPKPIRDPALASERPERSRGVEDPLTGVGQMPRTDREDTGAPVSPVHDKEGKACADATRPEDNTELPTPRGPGRKTRKRGKNSRRHPKRNDLAMTSYLRFVDGFFCLMTSKIYIILGYVATGGNAFKPHTIAVHTCARYNLVMEADVPPYWTRYVIRYAPLPRLAGANSNPLRLTAVDRPAVRLRNTTFRIPFLVAKQLAVPVLLGTAFIYGHVRSIDFERQKHANRQGGSLAIVDRKGEPTLPTSRHGRQTSRADARDEAPQAIRIARWVTIPMMSQARVRFITAGRGLVFIEPKPSLQHRHGVRLANWSSRSCRIKPPTSSS